MRWLVHSGRFSTLDGTLIETFHEVLLEFQGEDHRLNAVRLLDGLEVEEMVAALKLRPVEEIVDRLATGCGVLGSGGQHRSCDGPEFKLKGSPWHGRSVA